MEWKSVPSLHSLRAFEVVSRCGTYSAAARELNVTEAAIRQHMRQLEGFLGVAVVVREGRGIGLTDEGLVLSQAVGNGFRAIQQSVAQISQSLAQRPVRVALPPSFAERWLMRRLGQFVSEHPDIRIELGPSLQIVDLERDGFDLAIRYGAGNWPGYISEYLASADYVVVAAPAFVTQHELNGISGLGSLPWLFETGREEHRRWATDHGIEFEADQNRFYPSNSLVLSAACAGQGLSLQALALVEDDIEEGRLNTVHQEDAGALGYYLVMPHDRTAKTEFVRSWLMKQQRSFNG